MVLCQLLPTDTKDVSAEEDDWVLFFVLITLLFSQDFLLCGPSFHFSPGGDDSIILTAIPETDTHTCLHPSLHRMSTRG
jgi:hypothetical protein